MCSQPRKSAKQGNLLLNVNEWAMLHADKLCTVHALDLKHNQNIVRGAFPKIGRPTLDQVSSGVCSAAHGMDDAALG